MFPTVRSCACTLSWFSGRAAILAGLTFGCDPVDFVAEKPVPVQSPVVAAVERVVPVESPVVTAVERVVPQALPGAVPAGKATTRGRS